MLRRFPGVPAGVIAAATLMAAGLAGTQPALAAAASPVFVPCSTRALASAMAGAGGGETIRLTAFCDYVLTAALPPVAASLTIEGRGATLKRSTAAGTPAFSLLSVSTGDADLTVSGLTFRNGNGGAINMTGGTTEPLTNNLTVTRSTFAGNTGGAINLGGTDDTTQVAASVTGSVFTGNTGGGINDNGVPLSVTGSTFTYNIGGGINTNKVALGIRAEVGGATVTRSAFTGNTGGGITCGNPGEDCEVTVTRSVFTGNSGSGISAQNYSDAAISVTHSVFRRNTASYGGGIALNGFDSGILTATDDVFTGNTASAGGGGVYNWDSVTLTGDTFTGNSAAIGGAVENEWHVTATDTTFRRNKASADGGAIYQINTFGSGILSIKGGRVTGNSAGGDGGGIYNYGSANYKVGPPPAEVYISPSTTVRNNQPDNCAPLGSIPSCAG
jgi:predicted outer membrane repeat protein